jgi:hypothetical protein
VTDSAPASRKAFLWGPLAIVDRYGPTLGPYALAVYAALARGVHDNDAQVSDLSRRDIQRLTGISPTKVKDTLKLLRQLGLIASETVTDDQGKQLENRYTLLDPPEQVVSDDASPPVHGDVVRDMHSRFWAVRHWVLDLYGNQMGAFGIACYVVLARYVDYNDRQTVRFVAKSRIREHTGMALSTITAALHHLAALGVLAIQEQQTADGQLANIYTLQQQPHEGGLKDDGGGLHTVGGGRLADGRGHIPEGGGRQPNREGATARTGMGAPRSLKNNTSLSTILNNNGEGNPPGGKDAKDNRKMEPAVDATRNGTASDDVHFSAAMEDLHEQMVPTNFARWIARLRFGGIASNAITVICPDEVSKDQLQRRFDPLVRRALQDAFALDDCRVTYEVRPPV